jgi:germination protein M
MKKAICMFLSFVLIFVLCGCNNHDNIAFPVKFYYRTVPVSYGTNASIITAEVRDASEFRGNYTELIELYLNGPKQYSCISPFPAGTTLEEISLSGNKMQILLSPHMAVLSGSELMVACACLSRTIIELTGVSTVQISSENSLLNNQEFITVTSNSFAYLDTE